jgi:hypothetical protein
MIRHFTCCRARAKVEREGCTYKATWLVESVRAHMSGSQEVRGSLATRLEIIIADGHGLHVRVPTLQDEGMK